MDEVSSKMKLIENSLGNESSTGKNDVKDINEVIYELEGEIKVKENQISEYVTHHTGTLVEQCNLIHDIFQTLQTAE